MVIQAFLQTSPGVFSVFYHHALGKTTAKRADDRALSFILGQEIAIAIFFLTTYLVISFLSAENISLDTIFMWILSGLFLVEALFIFFCYFRSDKKSKNTTKLFYPKVLTKSIIYHIEHVKNRTDTIALGFITAALDFIFILPLFIISSIAILHISSRASFLFIIAYIIIATLPLFTIRTLFRTSHNLAEIQRFRVKKKLFFRLVLTISYLALGILTFISGASI